MVRRINYLLLFISLPLFANNRYGINVSDLIYPREISKLRGYQVMFDVESYRLMVGPHQLYFDGGFSHFWVKHFPKNREINIYSVAPVYRYNFANQGGFFPYVEASVGFSVLSHRYIEKRNLGLHFSFQDRLGAGVFLGPSRKFSLGIHMLHYSNADISSHNSGITVPIVLDVGIHFE